MSCPRSTLWTEREIKYMFSHIFRVYCKWNLTRTTNQANNPCCLFSIFYPALVWLVSVDLFILYSFFQMTSFLYIAVCILIRFPSDPPTKGVCPLSPLVFHFLNRSCRFFWIESFSIALFYTEKGSVVWRNAGMKCIYCEALAKCFIHNNNIYKRAC